MELFFIIASVAVVGWAIGSVIVRKRKEARVESVEPGRVPVSPTTTGVIRVEQQKAQAFSSTNFNQMNR